MEKLMQMDGTMEETLWEEDPAKNAAEIDPEDGMADGSENCANDETEESEGFLKDNRGIGVIEMVLILVVLVGLVLIFKNQLNSIIGDVFDKVNSTINRL